MTTAIHVHTTSVRTGLIAAVAVGAALPALAAGPAQTEAPVSDEKAHQLLAQQLVELTGIETAQVSILQMLSEIQRELQQHPQIGGAR